MAWKAVDRNEVPQEQQGPGICDALAEKIRSFFPRYETKRAALLPALRIVQDDIGYLSLQAMQQVADLLEIPASDVRDVATFYAEFWTHPKGKKVITVCRSITCETMGGNRVLAECKKVLGIDEHETTPDGEYSLVTEECLAACDHGPCMMINERKYKCVDPAKIRSILEDKDNDRLDIPRSDLYDGIKDK